MKHLSIVILTLLISFNLSAQSAQILRATVSPVHFDQNSVKGGVIGIKNGSINLTVVLQPQNPNDPKDQKFNFKINGVKTDNCGSIIYISEHDNYTVYLTDYSQASNCDTVELFPVTLVYTTTDEEGTESTSKFDASDFIDLEDKTQFLEVGNTTPSQQNSQVYQSHENPVILPVIDVM